MRPVLICLGIVVLLTTAAAQSARPSYSDSLVLAPLYIEYARVSDQKFADEAAKLRRRIGSGPHVLVGFAAFLNFDYDGTPELDRPIQEEMLASKLREADLIVDRARANGLVTHIGLISGFFHDWNRLREVAIRGDVRNAQWFADGFIGPPADLNADNISRSIWITPSTYAKPLRARMEETVRLVAKHLAEKMAAFPETLLSISGDGEVELTWERNLGQGVAAGGRKSDVIYTDYSPFAVAEFRDSLRYPAYKDDLTPDTDDDGDGHTFNKDFGQAFKSWRLKYFDESGPVPLASYIAMPKKLPDSGMYYVAGGFDAPRTARPGNRFWDGWMQFRKQMVAGYEQDFARWVTTSAAATSSFIIPSTRFYSHQIPAEFLFEQPDNIRLYTSASPLETAFLDSHGSIGITAYNLFDGKRHLRTAIPELFSRIVARSANWGVLEYNPSMPSGPTIQPSKDEGYYLEQLRMLYSFRPHVIVPFSWTDLPEHKQAAIQGRPFESALAKFVKEAGKNPWSPRK